MMKIPKTIVQNSPFFFFFSSRINTIVCDEGTHPRGGYPAGWCFHLAGPAPLLSSPLVVLYTMRSKIQKLPRAIPDTPSTRLPFPSPTSLHFIMCCAFCGSPQLHRWSSAYPILCSHAFMGPCPCTDALHPPTRSRPSSVCGRLGDSV